MFDQQGSKKSLQIEISDLEFAKSMHYFVTIELEEENIRRRTDISEKVDTPIFQQNRFIIPFDEQMMNRNPVLVYRIFIVGDRYSQSDEALYK